MLSIQKFFSVVFLLLLTNCAMAQETWPSPEVEQMYRHAKEYMALGNLNDAIITYKHAISLAPGKMVLYRDLGNALFLSGRYNEAEQALSSVNSMPDADAQCYRILAASQAAQSDFKSARATLKKGIGRFPDSGLLYHEKGMVSAIEKKPEDALNAWLDGIRREPAYPQNYYEAAHIYLNSDKVLWGLLYGEIYINIAHDTANMQDMKKMLFTAYKTMFDNISKDVPGYGKENPKVAVDNFSDAVRQVYASLTPVVSDGITTENLTMVRTRFVMDWFSRYNDKYPFSLFSYLDELIRTGHFDIYNEWLFGKAESVAEYASWNTFHEGDLARFSLWQNEHQLHPATRDFYNNRNIEGLFNKIKYIDN